MGSRRREVADLQEPRDDLKDVVRQHWGPIFALCYLRGCEDAIAVRLLGPYDSD